LEICMPRSVKMPSLEDIKAAYTGSGSRAAAGYVKGVDRVTDFVERAAGDSAEANFNSAMTTVLAGKLRARGLREKTTNESWKSDAKTKGGAIIGTRIAGAGDKQSRGYAPVHAALSGLELPDKMPDDPIGNLTRIAGRVVAAAANVKRRRQGKPEVTPPG